MGWCRIERTDLKTGQKTITEYGDDPLADKTKNPALSYSQDQDDWRLLSTTEDEAGL